MDHRARDGSLAGGAPCGARLQVRIVDGVRPADAPPPQDWPALLKERHESMAKEKADAVEAADFDKAMVGTRIQPLFLGGGGGV